MNVLDPIALRIEQVVLYIHRRNGGQMARLDFEAPLLDAALGLDSLDLAEIIVSIEKEMGFSPFESGSPPKTWNDILLRAKEIDQLGPSLVGPGDHCDPVASPRNP